MADLPPWAVRRVTSVNVSAAARERLALLAADLKVSRSDLVDALVRGYTLEECRATVRRMQIRDGEALAGWKRGG